VFDWLQDVGKTTDDEMHRTFNMGIGMILAVSPDKVDTVLAELQAMGEPAVVLGDLVDA
jgi:phosphoribosylformylglycinamidine cyclo-ligase